MIPDYWAQWSLCVRNAWSWLERCHETHREEIDHLVWIAIQTVIQILVTVLIASIFGVSPPL